MPRANTTDGKPQLSFCSRQQRFKHFSSVPLTSPVPGNDYYSSVYGSVCVEYRYLVGSLLKHYLPQSTKVPITQRTNSTTEHSVVIPISVSRLEHCTPSLSCAGGTLHDLMFPVLIYTWSDSLHTLHATPDSANGMQQPGNRLRHGSSRRVELITLTLPHR
jgi:hypothetical protein